MDKFDVVIIGGGPAGCAAAFDLARTGLRVAILDRANFPRTKPCAGALTIKAVKALRYSIGPVIEHVATDLEVTLRGTLLRRFSGSSPICVMTVRRNFDEYCLGQAIENGAKFIHVKEISRIEEAHDRVFVHTADGSSFVSAFVIGADGANSRVRRLLDQPPAQRAIAIEAHVDFPQGVSDFVMRFDFGYVDGGYGWIFPKAGHLNVGLYTHHQQVKINRAKLVRYAQKTLGTDEVTDVVGYPIGIGGEKYEPKTQRVFLAGDAAGMTDPLLGEGIYNAIKTGQAAAKAIEDHFRHPVSARQQYITRISEVRSDLAACSSAAKWFYDLQFLGFGALVSHPARTALMRGFAAGMTFKNITQTFFLAPFYPIPRLPSIEDFRARIMSTRTVGTSD